MANFFKSFNNGIFLVVISLLIPILFLGITGVIDDVFAQNQSVPNDLMPVYVGTIDHSNLIEETRGKSHITNTPFLTKNPQLHDETKEHPLKMKTSKKMAKIITQLPSQDPEPAAVNEISGFDGITQNGFIPPDVQIATGPNYVVEMVNTERRIWNTQGNFESSLTLQAFFGASDVPFDPKIFYDTQSSRWFASATTFDNIVYIAVSTTDDPRSTWNIYTIDFAPQGQPARFPDQPRIGASDDKFVISINVFHPNNGNYFGVSLFILDKSQMIAGGSVSGTQLFDTSSFSVKPVQSLSSTSELYMVSTFDQLPDSTVTLWTVTGSATNLTLDENGMIPTLDLTIDPASIPPNAKQMITETENLSDTGDIRIQDAKWFQGDLWFALANACTPTGDTVTRSCIHLVQIDTTSNPPAVTQDIQYGENGFYFFYPAISVDQFGGLGVVFGHSSESTYPSLAVTGQPAGSALNTLHPRNDIKLGSDINPTSRTGDYFGVATDPTNPSVFWVAGEFRDSASWSTWVATINVSDTDDDGVINVNDNCPNDFNPIQEDSDNDGIGDVCDPTTGTEEIVAFQGHGYFRDALDVPMFNGDCGVLTSVCWALSLDLGRDVHFSTSATESASCDMSTTTHVVNNCSRRSVFYGDTNQESRCSIEQLPQLSRHTAFDYNGGIRFSEGVGREYFSVPRHVDDMFIPGLDKTSVPGDVFDFTFSPGLRELNGKFILDRVSVAQCP